VIEQEERGERALVKGERGLAEGGEFEVKK